MCLDEQESDKESQLSEELLGNGHRNQYGNEQALSESYYYDEEYTNSQYLRSDDQNSIVDQKHFKYDQSLRDTASREVTENTSDYSTKGGLAAGSGDNGSHINPQAAPSINSAIHNNKGLRRKQMSSME